MTDTKTQDLEKRGDYYHPLLNLLCALHKIQFCHYQARQSYKQARELYGDIEGFLKFLSDRIRKR